MDYNVDYFLNTRVTGNGFSEGLGNLCLAPVRVLFEGRTVYKIDQTYITNIPAVRRQGHVVARVIVTAAKIFILIPFTPLLTLGVILKVIALISRATVKNHVMVIESYKSSSEKDNLMLGSDGWVRILGGKEDFSSNFLTLTSSEQRHFFSALSSLTRNPQELNFFDCDVSFIDEFCCSYKGGAALLDKVKKISIKPENTYGYKSTVKSLFQEARLLKEMNIEGDILKDKDFLQENQKNLGKIPNVDWSQVNISSLKGLIDIVEGTPTMSEANRLKLFASYWKSSLANGSDPTLDFSVIYTKPKQFYNVRNIELLISQCKGLKKVSIPMDFTLVHVEAIKKSCPTLREINFGYSNSFSDFQIDAFAKRNPTIRISGKRPHAPVGTGFDADDHLVMSLGCIERIFKQYPLLTKDNKRALFAKLWKESNKYNTFSGSKVDFSSLYASLEQSDLELFAQECKGIKKMTTNRLMTPSQITIFLKNLPKPSTLEKLEFDYNSKKIQEIHLEDFMKACPGIKELDLWGCCGIPDESQALKDFSKKYPGVEIKGKLFGGSSSTGGTGPGFTGFKSEWSNFSSSWSSWDNNFGGGRSSSKPKDSPRPSTNNSRPADPPKPAPQTAPRAAPQSRERTAEEMRQGDLYEGFSRCGNLTIDAQTCQRLKRKFLTQLGLTEVEADRTAFTKVGSIAKRKKFASHPDKNGGTPESNKKFQDISNACDKYCNTIAKFVLTDNEYLSKLDRHLNLQA